MGLFKLIWDIIAKLYAWTILKVQTFFIKRAAYNTVMVRIAGNITEAPPPFSLFQRRRQGGTPLINYISLFRTASKDPKVKRVVIRVGRIGAGWGKIQELAQAIESVNKAGKQTVAFFERGGNKEYYLASACSKIIAPPSATINLIGLMLEMTYLKDMFEKLDVKPEVFAKGQYKNAMEGFTRKSPSPASKEVTNYLLEGLSDQLAKGIAAGRNVEAKKVVEWIDSGPHVGSQAVETGLLDGTMYYEEFVKSLKKEKPKAKTIKGSRYLKAWSSIEYNQAAVSGKGYIALVYAPGPILERGMSKRASNVTTDRLCDDLRRIAKNKKIKVVVLRVSSPGGVSSASDLIWKSLMILKGKKPVIVSMGDVAASGGYYLSMAGDEVFTMPGTITGSIGVVMSRFNLKGLYRKLGLSKFQFKSGQNAGLFGDYGPLSSNEKSKLNSFLDHFYTDFVSKVADCRGMALEDTQKLAQGRIHLGADAQKNGLADNIGGLDDALALAKKKMNLAVSVPVRIEVYPRRKTPWQALREGGLLSTAEIPQPLQSILDDAGELATVQQGANYRMPYKIDIE